MFRLHLTIMILVLSASPVWSVTYYAAPGGSDSGTGAARCTRAQTAGTPLLTINIAVECAHGGDTVQLGAGMFVPRQRIDLNESPDSTTRTTYLTIQGAIPLGPTVTNKAGATILDGAGLGNGWMVYGRHVKYTIIRHLEIRNHTGGGIGLFGHTTRVDVTDNYVHDNSFTAAQGSAIRPTSKYSVTTNTVQGAEIGVATYVTVARNDIRRIKTGFTAAFPSGSESLTVAGNISHFLIEDNRIDDGQFVGIDMIGKSPAWWTTCGNVAHPQCFPTLPISGETWPRLGIVRRNTIINLRKGQGPSDVGIYCDGCRDILIEENRVDGTAGYCYGISTEENGFFIDQVLVRRNIGIGCSSADMLIGPPQNAYGHGTSDHLRIAHNTALKTKIKSAVSRFFFTNGAKFLNNIVAVSVVTPVPEDVPSYISHVTNVASTSPALDFTLYWGGKAFWEYKGHGYTSMTTYQTGSHQDAQGLIGDPRFTNVAARTLTLGAGSAARDRGTPLTRTTATSGTGTTVPVLDARWFSDGYGIVGGDTVQVGSALTVVTGVNYAANTLTVAPAVSWTPSMSVTYPYADAAPDIGACEGATCGSVAGPIIVEPTDPAPAVALLLTHTCGTPANTLTARVMGSLVMVAPEATIAADTLLRSQCASAVTLTDVASVLPPAYPRSDLVPWKFLGTTGPNVGNTCTNCLSVHTGTPSLTEAGAGYTFSGLRQGTSVASALGGASLFSALPGLCHHVVDGVVTTTPLWPWPMDARIVAARSLAGRSPLEVTFAVEAALGPILPACTEVPVGEPQPVWFVAPTGVDGGACTFGAPCATLAHVGSRMAPGNTLLLRAGTYAQAIAPGMVPGGSSWAAPTTIAAYELEEVILSQPTGILAAFTAPATDRYVLLAGLTLDGGGVSATTSQGLVVGPGAGPLRFQAGTIRGTAAERVVVDGGQGVELLQTTVQGGLAGPAISVSGTTHGFLLKESRVETSPGAGVVITGPHHTQVRVTQTTLTGNAEAGLVVDAPGVLLDNLVVAGNGLGVQVAPNAAATQLVNLTLADNTGVGLQIDAGADATAVTNTLLWGNAGSLVDFGEGTTLLSPLITNPGFVGGGDYHIALGTSPALDTGTPVPAAPLALDGVTRPQGTGWDIGAYERAGTPVVCCTCTGAEAGPLSARRGPEAAVRTAAAWNCP